MNQSFQVIDQSISEQIQHKISISLNISLTQINDFFSKLHLPDNVFFIFDAIERVAALRCNFIDRMNDDLDFGFIDTVKLAEKIVQSSVLDEIRINFPEISIEEWIKRQAKGLTEEALHEVFLVSFMVTVSRNLSL